jgi:simple sugar transport system ATP-binding protein
MLAAISKRFGPVQALDGADFHVGPGEVHALLGENGAGKTTLMHIAYGLVRPDAGEIRLDGVQIAIGSPRMARRHGIGMVHQHFTSVPALNVAENVALTSGWKVSPRRLSRRVLELSQQIGLPLDPEVRAGRLSVGLKQRLEIVKALAADARILLLDEPTAVLAPGEADDLLRVMRGFASKGGSAVLITHKLDEALAAADRVTVLRRGRVVLNGAVADYDATMLGAAMIGADPSSEQAAPGRVPASVEIESPVRVRVDALDVPRESGHGIVVRGASLRVAAGEIVGVAAVEGNGQRELLRAVAGRLLPLRGRLEVEQPVGFIPEDRTTEGLIPELTLTENVVLGSRAGDPWLRGGGIDWRQARLRTAALLDEFGVVAPGPDARAGVLSGGNQQKLVAARELGRGPKVVVAENPTRGLDFRATATIHARLRAAAAAGAAVLLHSSDLDEVLALSDRVLVAVRGVIREVPRGVGRGAVGELMVAGGR